MGELKHGLKSSQLFNCPLETGTRTMIILNAVYPRSFDLMTLTWLDYVIVHTADFNGPESLHPSMPQRGGEIIVRRRLIEESLTFMCQLHLIKAIHTEDGVKYQVTDDSYSIVQLMRTTYAIKLKERAKWLSQNISTLEGDSFDGLLSKKVGRWGIEFLEKNKLDKEIS